MTSNNYLGSIVYKYRSADIQSNLSQLNTLILGLKNWANTCFNDIKYSGSCAKRTAISLSSDVDIFISLKPNCNENAGGLAGIYQSLHSWLKENYSNVRIQNVSFRIMLGDLEVDITPARKYSGNTNFHNLYVSKKKSWTKSNPDKHILDVSNSGRQNEIKLLKIWKELHGLDFPSIYLEYLTITNLLYNKPKGSEHLSDNFWKALQALASDTLNPLTATISDPANTNNNLSNLLNNTEKIAIKNAAKKSITHKNWSSIVW